MLNEIISVAMCLMMTSIINMSKTWSETYKILRLYHQRFYKRPASGLKESNSKSNKQNTVECLCKWKHESVLLQEAA